RLRRGRHLRRGLAVPDRLPRRHRHRRADEAGAPRPPRRAGATRGRGRRPALARRRHRRTRRPRGRREGARAGARHGQPGRPGRPAPGRPRAVAAVFSPACIDELFGPADTPGEPVAPLGATRAFEALCARAGLALAVPDGIAGLCCGTPWRSKGLDRGYAEMARRTFEAVWEASDGGRLPVVTEAGSCTLGLAELGDALTGEALDRYRRLRVLDAVTYARTELLPRLTVTARLASVAVHPTCSSMHTGAADDLLA